LGSTPAAAQDLLDFWFSSETKPNWFTTSDGFDNEVRQRFGILHEAAASGQLDDWAETPEGALALILLLDQVPRNMFRGSALAFATDGKALELAKKAVIRGLDIGLQKDERLFLYLPFEHAEDLAAQDEAVRLIEALGDDDYTRYAHAHRETIRRFGRFPYRNAALQRPSTTEELAFLKAQADQY
jgi:uncharacterized protein (DUF924 family)